MIQKQNNNSNRNTRSLAFLMMTSIFVVLMALIVPSAHAVTDTTRPTIISISPMNNERDLPTNEQITIVFSEDMNPATINTHSITVMQRTTPETEDVRYLAVAGTITYIGRTATFTSTEVFSPSQQYGNVFTVTITPEATDLAGNALSRDYVWSFTTGGYALYRFYTDATTSQLDQSATPTNGTNGSAAGVLPIVTPVVTQPPTVPGATDDSTTNAIGFPWVLAIGALVFIGLIVTMFVVTRKSSNQKTTVVTRTTSTTSIGEGRPVLDLEGIGPEYNKKLHAMGIQNTNQLWKANAAQVAAKTGASINSELASVKDIGPQYAELLDRSGIHSIEELKNSNPHKLLRLVRKKQDSLKVNIQGNSPGKATVEHWIAEAQVHQFGVEGQIA
jgi:hypothetical protein